MAVLRGSWRLWRNPRCHIGYSFSTMNVKSNVFPVSTEIRSANRRIRELVRDGRIEDARAYFDSLSCRNTVTWNSMISGYLKKNEILKARKLFDEMPMKDMYSWNLMIQGYMTCCSLGYVEEGRNIFENMLERDIVTWNTMISGYAKNGRMEDAIKIFDSMPERNVVTWNTIITGFLSNSDVKKACEWFKRMPIRDSGSINALVSGLIQNDEMDEAKKILFEYSETCRKEDLVHAINTLIAGYGRKGRVADARCIFDSIPDSGKNIVSWNSMLMAYVNDGNMPSAADLFDQMKSRDAFSWNTMITGYVHASDLETALKLFSQMRCPDSLSWNSLISGYAQAGKMELALSIFQRMPQKNLISWNTMIAGYERNLFFKEAIQLFLGMQEQGEKPDLHTLSSLLSVCAQSAEQHLGVQIHQLVVKKVIPDVTLNNALITMYARCGMITEAKRIFDDPTFHKNVISWNAMIGGYASHGHAKMALELFESMKVFKVTPTYITFISVLSACAHGGLVEEAKSYFRSMACDFGIKPRVEHFTSLVDVVGRHGKVNEAMDIIKSMPVEPDKPVWGALLGACRVHNNLQLAKVAAEALILLEPENSGPYVLLYNMYVDAGKWSDADEIRMVMERKNIKKEPGYSMVDCRQRMD